MNKPKNSAARNVLTPFERQCFDWGWEDGIEYERARIVAIAERWLADDDGDFMQALAEMKDEPDVT